MSQDPPPAPPTSAPGLQNGPGHADWTVEAEAALISYLQTVKQEGKISDNNFKSQAYAGCALHLHGLHYSFTGKQVKT